MEKVRSTNWCLVLYQDDVTHVKALEIIKEKYNYACILHDKDLNNDNELKKSHYHVVLYTGRNAKWNTSIANELGIEVNYLQQCKNRDKALEYLIHHNDSSKYQYNVEDVQGDMKTRLKELINTDNRSESEIVSDLISYIYENDTELTVTQFATYCAKNGYWSEYRRASVIFNKILEEHNTTIKYKNDL